MNKRKDKNPPTNFYLAGGFSFKKLTPAFYNTNFNLFRINPIVICLFTIRLLLVSDHLMLVGQTQCSYFY